MRAHGSLEDHFRLCNSTVLENNVVDNGVRVCATGTRSLRRRDARVVDIPVLKLFRADIVSPFKFQQILLGT